MVEIEYNKLNKNTKRIVDRAINLYINLRQNPDVMANDEINDDDVKAISFLKAAIEINPNIRRVLTTTIPNLDELIDKVVPVNFKYQITDVNKKMYDTYLKNHIKRKILKYEKNNSFENGKVTIKELTPETFIFVVCQGEEIIESFEEEYDRPLFYGDNSPEFCGGIGMEYNSKEAELPQDSEYVEVPEKEKEQIFPKDKDRKTNIWEILDNTKAKFIGQEQATEDLFYNVLLNQQLATLDDCHDGERSIIFLDGPTGTGKTAIAREITERLGLPFVATAITNYSSTGYKGNNINDILEELYISSKKNIKQAQKGIVVLDELDKLAYTETSKLDMKKAVQQELLDFLGGGSYILSDGSKFDTSKLTFICLAALTDLRKNKSTKKQPIGFEQEEVKTPTDYDITPQDLINIGLEKELVGRFNTYIHTEEYDEETLKYILKESTISPIKSLQKWIEANGKKLTIDDEVINEIANEAYRMNTGARALQTVTNNIRTRLIREVLRGEDDMIHLDLDSVKNISSSQVKRKVINRNGI